MVEGQVRPNRVTNPLIVEAMRRIPREQFLPRHLQSIAYIDEDIPLGNGRFLPEPMVLARLVQELEVGKNDVVLDIGCGTGYSSAILGHLAATVVGIEQDAAMAAAAEKLLHGLGIVNAAVVHRKDMAEGYAQQGPYNAILINGAVSKVPERIKHQLADGGRLAALVSDKGHIGTAVRVTRRGDSFVTEPLFDAAAPFLPGFEAAKGFSF